MLRHWHIHLGAHKTATTHLQNRLEQTRPALDSLGVGLALPEQLRPERVIDLRMRRPVAWLGRGLLRRDIETRLAAQVPLHTRMVISDEEILGNAAAPLEAGFYPRAMFRVRALNSALTSGGLWLSVRRLDHYVSAAYSTALKHIALPVTRAHYKARILARPPDWSDLVARLVQAAPNLPITVWDYADYRANSMAIFSDLTGVSLDNLPEVSDPISTRTPDEAAIRTAEALTELREPHVRAKRIGEIFEASTGPRFTLFDVAEEDMLNEFYAAQLNRIRAMPKVRFLSF